MTVAIGTGDAVGGDFPAAIQDGSCDGLSGTIVFELDDLRGGVVSEEISASLEELGEQDHALVVFQSGDRNVFVACADL